jgi:uncharacterized protein (DUF1778 family)
LQTTGAPSAHASAFVLEQGTVAGMLADRRLFLIDEGRWQAFLGAMECPANDRPALKRLLAEPGLLD